MKPKYTKGRWTKMETDNGVSVICERTNKQTKAFQICLMSERDITSEEMEQNAKLIASAPELLENLKRIIDRVEECKYQDAFPSAYERAKEIIKRATNEE